MQETVGINSVFSTIYISRWWRRWSILYTASPDHQIGGKPGGSGGGAGTTHPGTACQGAGNTPPVISTTR